MLQDPDSIVCESDHLTTFSSGMAVAPNAIDWAFVFANLDFFKNPTLYVTEILILVSYIAAVIWARRKDNKDIEKVRHCLQLLVKDKAWAIVLKI